MNNLYDVVVIGGGPAGLTAALYLARARYRVVVVEKEHFGGQITITHEVVNYPGVARTSGKDLTEVIRKQAKSFGAEFLLAEAKSLDLEGDMKVVNTSRGELKCFGILLATGAHPRMIGFKGEEDYRGRGVAYCATCDGEFFTGKEVFVVGGGFAAAEESVFLTKYAKHVTLLVREPDFTCAKATAEAARNHDKITVFTNTEVEEVYGDTTLRGIRYRNNVTGEITEFKAETGDTIGVFVFAGYVPATALIKGVAKLDPAGYVVTDRSLKTSADGLYAAGDVCIKPLRQVVTAVGDGALAATELERYASEMHKKTGLHPEQPVTETTVPEMERKSDAGQASAKKGPGELFDADMLEQLNAVFARMASSLVLKLYLNDRPVATELRGYMEALANLTDKLAVELSEELVEDMPCVKIFREDGSYSGLAFHGAPGGHEFTSFVLGLYNAAGPGQSMDADVAEEVKKLDRKADMKVLVSLSCTMCPELVTAAQKLAAENPNVTAEVYDLNHYPDIRDRYDVMSVPCLVINNGEKVSFGKKNMRQLLDLIG